MTTVAVLADPPRDDVVLPEWSPSPLTQSEATLLYRAMLADVLTGIDGSGGELLVNYRDDDQLPAADGDAAAELRSLVEDTLDSPGDVRFEVQVGSTPYARVGNTITHLLDREAVDTAAVVEPSAAFLTRSTVDSAAMKLRSADVVLGPSTDGRIYYAGFRESIDFSEIFEPPVIETVTRRAREAGYSVDFLPMLPVIERPADLLTAIPALRSRREAGRGLPVHTAAAIEDIGLSVQETEDGLTVTQS